MLSGIISRMEDEVKRDELPDNYCDFIILGEPASLKNSRRIVSFGGKPRLIKSKKALGYVETFALQCPSLKPLLEEDVRVEIDIWYASRRPDLCGALILDEMQGRIYVNDRQVKHQVFRWHLDRDNPRSRIQVGPLHSSVLGA